MQEQEADMFKKSEFESSMFLTDEELRTINGDINLSLVSAGVLENFLEDEDTLEAAPKQEPQFEIITPQLPFGPPETGSFPGALNFAVEINGSEVDKTKYLYSASLNRIYVDMGVNFPIHFTWDIDKQSLMYNNGQDLYVRATVVFSDESQAEKRVERCLQHAHEPNNPGNEAIVKNVLRSTRALGTSGVYYCGLANQLDSWLSVLVQFPAPGGHAYQFVCKNSCSSGINRRSIAIIFTLEDQLGTVLGRQSVGARVCACPRRDLNRDEAELKGRGKRKINHAPPDTLKKVKIEVADHDDEVITLPKISIKGVKTAITGLEVMQRMMELSASEAAKRSDQKSVDEYKKCLATLVTTTDNLKKSLKPPV